MRNFSKQKLLIFQIKNSTNILLNNFRVLDNKKIFLFLKLNLISLIVKLLVKIKFNVMMSNWKTFPPVIAR